MKAKHYILIGLTTISPYILGSNLAFIFLIPLLMLLYSSQDLKNLTLVILLFSACCIALSPMLIHDPAIFLFALVVTALFMSVLFLLCKYLIGRAKSTLLAILIPTLLWTIALIVFSYKSLVSAAFDVGVLFPISSPLISFIGSKGITFLIVFFNSACAYYIVKKRVMSLLVAVLLLAALVGSYVYSVSQESTLAQNQTEKIKVALIQGDIEGKNILGYEENLDNRISRYIKLSEEALGENVDLIVWPEYTLPIDIFNHFPVKFKPISSMIKKLKVPCVIGSMYTAGETNYNAALIFNKNGELEEKYLSQDPAVFNREVTPGGENQGLFLGDAGVTLCWEEINGDVFSEYVGNGAEYFISLSSNTDLDYSWFKRYASYFARARAAENFRYIARATQTGVTEIINPYGKVVNSLPSGSSGYLVGEIFKIDDKTFYSKHGDSVVVFMVIIFSVIAIAAETIKRRAS